MNRPRNPLWLVPAVAVLLSYNTWMLLGPVNGNLAILNGYLSELAASGQPNNLFFRAGDMITSILVAVFGLVWVRRQRSVDRHQGSVDRDGSDSAALRRWWRLSALALLLFALSTFPDSFFSMDCSPTLSEACDRAEDAGTLSAVHYAHTFTSVGAQVGIVTSMLAAAISVTARASSSNRSEKLWVWGLAVVECVALVVMMVMLVAEVPGIGYPQGVMVLAASLWFATVGAGLAGWLPLGPSSGPVEEEDESNGHSG